VVEIGRGVKGRAVQCAASAAHTVVVAPRKRVIQYAVASRLITRASGILGRPVKPGDDTSVGAKALRHAPLQHPRLLPGMTTTVAVDPHTQTSSPAKAGDPVFQRRL
jgi:hypothetical protein